ncbi:eukaryotic translation initiation factor 4 gamma 3-like isoform X2 [Centruroides vittatus]|uniref:eukaryotic translation initiation factor 4 gamma 3-like isoform X2 n=1 Tax=Centruroides vittatus TaxID=120091 RepID=UPI0035106745
MSTLTKSKQVPSNLRQQRGQNNNIVSRGSSTPVTVSLRSQEEYIRYNQEQIRSIPSRTVPSVTNGGPHDMNKQAVLSQPSSVSNIYGSVSGPQHTQAGMPGSNHGPNTLVQQPQTQLQSQGQTQSNMQTYFHTRQNTSNTLPYNTRTSGMTVISSSGISSNAHQYTGQMSNNSMYAAQATYGTHINSQPMIIPSAVPMTIQYSQNQFQTAQYPISSSQHVIYRPNNAHTYYNTSGTMYFSPIQLPGGRSANSTSSNTTSSVPPKRKKKIICIQDPSGKVITDEIINMNANNANTNVGTSSQNDSTQQTSSIAAQFAEQVAALASRTSPTLSSASTDTAEGKLNQTEDSQAFYEDSPQRYNLAENLKFPPPLISAEQLDSCIEIPPSLPEELSNVASEKCNNVVDNCIHEHHSSEENINLSKTNNISVTHEHLEINSNKKNNFINESNIEDIKVDDSLKENLEKTREQEQIDENCFPEETKTENIPCVSEFTPEDVELSDDKSENVETVTENEDNSKELEDSNKNIPDEKLTDSSNSTDTVVVATKTVTPTTITATVKSETVKDTGSEKSNRTHSADASLNNESKPEGKEGKKSKAKKWKDLNRKGETKEGGDMDAFLDKTDVNTQDMSIPSLSPTPDSNVVEVIPQINTCESDTDLLEEKRKVAEKNEENIRVSMEVQNRMENNENSVTENSIKEPELKYNYSEDQWSPINPEGKKIYDRSFLLKLQGEPLCLQKPRNLPSVEIVKEKAHLQKLPDDNRPASAPMPPRNYSDPFMPNFASRQSRPPSGGIGRRQSQQGRDKPKKIITISNSFNQDVKLHECGNAWKPHVKKEIDDEDADKQKTQELEKKLRGILNKLTPQKFQTLVEQVKQLPIDNEERLKCVINLIFEKAIDEPNFSVPYANMCKHIAMSKLNVNTGNEKSTNFRKALLTKCQAEFERDNNDEINYKNRLQLIENAETGEKKKQLKEELEEEERKSRRRSLGNIKFIGELFKLHMLTASIMHECLKKLLHRGDEDSLECLCRLLTTIGKELDTEKKSANTNKPSSLINSYFESMKEIVERRTTTSRVRFMLQDVIELRGNNWVPRRDENNPKTIDQIHLEAHREAQEQQQLLQQTVFQKRSFEDRNMNRKGRGSANYQDDGWNMQSSKTKGTIDPSKLKLPKSVGETDIQLGHGFAKWGQGSSGGNVKNTNQDSENKSTVLKNRFSALATEQTYPNYEPRRGSQRSAASSRESSRSGSNNPPPPLRKSSSQTSTKERKQAIEAVKDFTNSDGHKQVSVSQTNETLTKETTPHLILKGGNFSNEEMEKKTKPLIDEFLHNSDLKEAILCVVETVNPTTAPVFISSAIFQVLERSSQSRHLIGELMHHLVKKKIITLDLYVKGLKSVLEMADDCAIDVPKIWQYLGELIEPMIQDNSISLAFLKDAAEPCKANGTAGKLMSELLHIVLKNQGSKRVAQLWKSSGLSWSDFLNENENITDFIKQNKLECTISKDDNQQQPLEKLSFDKIKEKLDTYLRKDADNEIIFDWIDANIEEKDRDTEFVRALATSLVENSIEGEVSVSRFDKKKLLPRLPLLQKYLDLEICLELQVLYALQAIVNRLEHPKGLLINIFQFLDDQDIISDEAFIQWEQSTDPAEQEGKGVALKSVTSFMLWIREQEDDSIEEN